MKLPNGITGFYHSKNNQPPKVDGKQFNQVCFAITTQNGGKVLEFREPQYPMNFYALKLRFLISIFIYYLMNTIPIWLLLQL